MQGEMKHFAAQDLETAQRCLRPVVTTAQEDLGRRTAFRVRSRDPFDDRYRLLSALGRSGIHRASRNEAAEDGALADGRRDLDAAGLQLA